MNLSYEFHAIREILLCEAFIRFLEEIARKQKYELNKLT